jgi:hypothetical protein
VVDDVDVVPLDVVVDELDGDGPAVVDVLGVVPPGEGFPPGGLVLVGVAVVVVVGRDRAEVGGDGTVVGATTTGLTVPVGTGGGRTRM